MFWAELTGNNKTCYFLLSRFFFLGPKIFEILEPESLLSCAGEPQ